ncbi:MAG: CooT family nickel-binding protein [Deltaproteobacteria bacterium]|nr:CooT family nickel-binding protein [Deltaproteobacteria bacterium]
MCDMAAFIVRDGMEEKILESVDLVEADGDTFELTNIFGDRRTLRARLKSLDNSAGKLLFEPR